MICFVVCVLLYAMLLLFFRGISSVERLYVRICCW